MLQFFTSRLKRDEKGVAMITVVLILFVMVLLSVTMFDNIRSGLNGVSRQRSITDARAAADAGVDQLVFVLKQKTAGADNWESMRLAYASSTAWWGWFPAGKGRFRAHVDCDRMDCVAGDPNLRVVTVEGEYPSGSGKVRTVQATLRKQAPAAFDFAMFADRAVTVHHHGGSYISPTIKTPKIHSNGDIKLDFSSSYVIDYMEATGNVTIGGSGQVPGGGGNAAYNWPYWVSGTDADNPKRCYPSKSFPPQDYSATYWNFPDAANTCPTTPKYSPNAKVVGDVLGNSVTVAGQGDTVAGSTATSCAGTGQPGENDPVTGVCIPARSGNVDGASVSVNGTSYTGVATGTTVKTHYKSGTSPAPCSGADCLPDCPKCNQGTADAGGMVGGVVRAHPSGWAPPKLDFPSLDYASTYLPAARADQNSGVTNTCSSSGAPNPATTCHVFPTTDGKDMFQYASNKNNIKVDIKGQDYSANPNPCSTCATWLDRNKKYTDDKTKVRYVVLRGTQYYPQNPINFDWASIRSLFATPSGEPTPTMMIKGNLVAEKGSMNMESSLTLVGPTMDPFNPAAPNLPSTTVPALMAAGGQIHAADYDSDSGWTAASGYEATKRNSTIVRGLVYSATWDAATKKSLAANQHWHNYDPKNEIRIIGAQVGSTLHDCNSFSFSYDPLVRNLTGFTAKEGNVYIINWKEL